MKKNRVFIISLMIGLSLSGCMKTGGSGNGDESVMDNSSRITLVKSPVSEGTAPDTNDENTPDIEIVKVLDSKTVSAPALESFSDHHSRIATYSDQIFYIKDDGQIGAYREEDANVFPEMEHPAVDIEACLEDFYITDVEGHVHIYHYTPGANAREMTVTDLKKEKGSGVSVGVEAIYQMQEALLGLSNVSDVSVMRYHPSCAFALVDSEKGKDVICFCGENRYNAEIDPSHGSVIGISEGLILYSDGMVDYPWDLQPEVSSEDYDYSDWTDVIGIYEGGYMAVREDGSVLVRDHSYATARKWTDVEFITSSGPSPVQKWAAFGLTKDGKVLSKLVGYYHSEIPDHIDKEIVEMKLCGDNLIFLDKNDDLTVFVLE